MKKLLLLLVVILTLASCERQSGRRVVGQEQKLYIIEYAEDIDDIVEVRFADKYSASQYRNTLDSLNLWSRLYSEPINKINSIK